MSEIKELLERFRRGGELLASTMTGAAGPELDWKPAPEKWSVRQLCCHLLDTEYVWVARFRATIAEDNPSFAGFDEDRWAQRLDYSRRKMSGVLESMRRTRAENFELLDPQPEEAFARTGVHSKRGAMSLLDMLRLATDHTERHILQIKEARAGYRALRAAQRPAPAEQPLPEQPA